MTLENCRSTTGRVCPEQVKGMARGVEAMAIVRWREGWWMKERERGREGETERRGGKGWREGGAKERTNEPRPQELVSSAPGGNQQGKRISAAALAMQ